MQWPEEGSDKNRRVLLSSPVLVYGRDLNDTPFHDLAPILSLHPRGGVVALAAEVRQGQTILLVNSETQENVACRVLYVGPELEGKRRVVFEFNTLVTVEAPQPASA